MEPANVPRSADHRTDAQLARDIHEGDHDGPSRREAEAELCRRFGPRVRSYGIRHLRDRDAANELVQRVLVIVITRLRAREVRELDGIASFVLGTAHHVVQTMRRATAKMRPLSETEEPWFEPFAPASLDVERVADCMRELEERARGVVTLSFFDELTAGEIGSVLGTSAGNVRVLRHRALTALRECFERDGTAA
jgi:RNA polymerase sigma-70 factor, ECF subfamily